MKIFMIMIFTTNVFASSFLITNNGDNTVSIIKKEIITNLSIENPRDICSYEDNFLITSLTNDCGKLYKINKDNLLNASLIDFKFKGEIRSINPFQEGILGLLKDSNKLFFYNPKTNYYNEVDTPKGPRNLIFDDVFKKIWVTCNEDNMVAIYNQDLKKQQHILLPSSPYAIIQDSNKIYISSIGEDCITLLDKQSSKIEKRIDSGAHPSSMCIVNDNLLVTNFDTECINIISLKNKNEINSIKVGKQPFQVKNSENTKVFITLHGENSFIGFDCSNYKIFSRSSVGHQPHCFYEIK